MKKRLSLWLLCLLLFCLTLTGCGGLGFPSAGTGTSEDPSGNASIESSFAVHFIDVGQADAILVQCTGHTMLIDGGNVGDSNLIYSYLQKHRISHLDYVVCTHAHEDHVGGLSGALTAATAAHVLAPVTEYDSQAFRNFVSKANERGCEIEIPKAGDQFLLGDAKVTVIGPTKTYDETNNTSLVLRIEYAGFAFLFTGDMESDAETELVDSGVELSADVLKIGHHGSDTSSSYRFLRAVAPTYGVISVGTGNQYGHPHESILSRLRDADVTLYRTDLQGDIICSVEGGKLVFTTQKGSGAVTNPTETGSTESGTDAVTEYPYIGNLNSKLYHEANCSSLPKEENRIYFTSREEAEEKGYSPCSKCDP